MPQRQPFPTRTTRQRVIRSSECKIESPSPNHYIRLIVVHIATHRANRIIRRRRTERIVVNAHVPMLTEQSRIEAQFIHGTGGLQALLEGRGVRDPPSARLEAIASNRKCNRNERRMERRIERPGRGELSVNLIRPTALPEKGQVYLYPDAALAKKAGKRIKLQSLPNVAQLYGGSPSCQLGPLSGK